MARYRHNVTGELMADGRRFPGGMKAFGDAIHARGLLYGLYSDRGFFTCQHYPGLLDNEAKDVATMAAFGIDFLKNDGCYTTVPGDEGDGFAFQNDPSSVSVARSANETYARTYAAIRAAGRPIVHNVKGLDNGGLALADAPAVSNLRRCGGDIGDSYGSVVASFRGCNTAGMQSVVGPTGAAGGSAGYWNDPDSLVRYYEKPALVYCMHGIAATKR